MEAPDIPEIDEDPLLDVDSPEDVILAPEAESTEESGPRGLADSDDSSGGDGHSGSTPAVQIPSHSSQSSSEFVAAPDGDVLSSSDDTDAVIPSDSSSQ